MRIVTENLMEYIKNEIENIEYGSVIIKLIGNSNKVDVITESRQRFGIDDVIEKESTELQARR